MDFVGDKPRYNIHMHAELITAVTIDWSLIPNDSYLKTIPAVSSISSLPFHQPITFFVGENGTGKSTLLEAMAIAGGFNPEGGTRNYRFSTYDSHSELCNAMTLSRTARKVNWGYFLRAESFYNVATQEQEYWEEAGESRYYHHQSHGESFLSAIQEQFRPDSLYFLDEPEAALSPQRQLTLMREIYRCASNGSQFFIVSHSPILLGMPEAELLSFDENVIMPIAYEDTESYRITKLFLQQREQLLNYLLEEE